MLLLMEHIFVEQHQLTSPRIVASGASRALVRARSLRLNLTWVWRKLFVSEESWQPFINSNILCEDAEKVKVRAGSLA